MCALGFRADVGHVLLQVEECGENWNERAELFLTNFNQQFVVRALHATMYLAVSRVARPGGGVVTGAVM